MNAEEISEETKTSEEERPDARQGIYVYQFRFRRGWWRDSAVGQAGKKFD